MKLYQTLLVFLKLLQTLLGLKVLTKNSKQTLLKDKNVSIYKKVVVQKKSAAFTAANKIAI